MPEKQYWGPHGEYGPFSVQADGWPNRGEVLRFWRKAKRMSAKQVAEAYGSLVKGEPVTERWVTMAEKNNLIPKDENRRRLLAKILGIPPILFGLGSLSELFPQTVMADAAVLNVNGSTRTEHYNKFLDLLWQLDYTSTAQGSLTDINGMISDLRNVAKSTHGNDQVQVYELLCGFYPLASTIYNDQRNLTEAFNYADVSVKLADNINNNKMRAVALYQRGFIRLQQGSLGSDQVDTTAISAAITDFEQALPLSVPRLEAAILLDLALAQAIIKQRRGASANLDKASRIISKGKLEDGTFVDLFANVSPGRYNLGKAAALVALKEYDEADSELDLAEEKISPDQTRRHVWISVLRSQIYYGQGSYAIATETALSALKVSKGINSVNNINLIRNLYTQLNSDKCSYHNAKSVNELGVALVLP